MKITITNHDSEEFLIITLDIDSPIVLKPKESTTFELTTPIDLIRGFKPTKTKPSSCALSII